MALAGADSYDMQTLTMEPADTGPTPYATVDLEAGIQADDNPPSTLHQQYREQSRTSNMHASYR